MPIQPLHHNVELNIQGGGKAVIEGRTTVPFRTFVQLVLQRKVLSLFKNRGEEALIVSSDLLTDLASAPQDSMENRDHLVLVTLGVGILAGVFVLATAQIALTALGTGLGIREMLVVAGTILGLGLLAAVLARAQRRKKGTQKLTESMERMASLLSK